MNRELLQSHVLTGIPARFARFRKGSGGLADSVGDPKGLPPTEPGDEVAPGIPDPEVIITDDPALDGTIAEQPSVNTGTYDPARAVAYIRTAAAIQKATGAGPKDIDWAEIAAALGAGAAAGAAIGGPAGAIVGAIVGVFVYFTGAQAEYEASLPWNAYSEQFSWMRGVLPMPVMDAIWSDAPQVIAAGIPSIVEYIAAKMLLPRSWEQLAEDTGTGAGLEIAIRDSGLEGQVIVDTDRPLWRTDDGTYIPMSWLLDSWGGYMAAKAFYTKAGVDYPLTRLMANPAGSQSGDPDVAGIVSDGTGGVYMLKAAMYLYDSDGDGIPDTNVNPEGNGGGLAIAAGLALLALTTQKPTSRKSR